MRTVLYADVLFLINFGMDFISLWLTLLIVRRPSRALRLFAASFVGGVYGVVSVLIDPGRLLSLVLGISISAVMVLIAVPGKQSFRIYLRYTLILWGVGALLGGVVTAVCSFGRGSDEMIVSHNAPFFVLALAGAVSSLFVRLVTSFKGRRGCRIKIVFCGVTAELDALVDTGCLVREPVSGAPVVFISTERAKKFSMRDVFVLSQGVGSIDKLTPDVRRRTRVVSVGTPRGRELSLCVFPDSISVLKNKEERRVRAAVVFEACGGYGGCAVLVPASLI